MGYVTGDGIRCSECGASLTDAPAPYPACQQCGATARTFDMVISAQIRAKSELGYKQKRPGHKRPIAEGKTGDNWSRQLGRFVKRSLHVDRGRDHYRETVTDPTTGDVIHHCDEPLSEHVGHGDARRKRANS
jgi:hypothetical protein